MNPTDVTPTAARPAPATDALREQLAGFRVLVTAQRRALELGAALERRGAEVIHAPVLSIVPHVDDEQLLADTLAVLDDPPDTVVVTTAVGLRGWIEAADAAGRAGDLLAVLRDARLIARGPKARGAIQAAGLTADCVAESETSAEIRELLLGEGVAGHRVAVQHHGSGSDGLDEALTLAGAHVTSLVVYRWGPAPDPEAVRRCLHLVARAEVEAVVFTSAPGAATFLELATAEGVLEEVVAACRATQGSASPVLVTAVGPITAEPLREVGIEPLVPDRYRMGALIRGLVTALAKRAAVHAATPAGPLVLLPCGARLAGETLALSPAGLAVLRLLVEARGAVVTRQQILAALPGASRDPHAAEVAVARLRESLRDSLPDHRPAHDLVQTVIKRGYRLPVVPASAQESP